MMSTVRVTAFSLVPGVIPGPAHQQRHGERGLVDEEAVHRFLVLVEALAVIGRDDEERVVAKLRRRERRVDPAHQLVGPRHFPVVRTSGVLRRVWLRRLVGIVRIVEVHPREAPVRTRGTQPRRHLRHRGVAALLNRVQEAGIVLADVELVRVIGEPARQPGLPRQHDRRDERRGLEARSAGGSPPAPAPCRRAAARRCRECRARPDTAR